MLKGKISPSMMCADIAALPETLQDLKGAGIEYLHIDVMDGVFVPNFTLGTDYVRQLHALTDIPLDIHLMIDRPEGKIGWFDLREGDYVSVHYESTPHIHRALACVRAAGAKAMLAINPGTPLAVLDHLLDDIDAVLVMTVNPGFAGQKLVESGIAKIAALRKRLDESGYAHIEIEVDGNVSFVNAKRMREAGANIFVAGTSSIFTTAIPFGNAVQKLWKNIR